MSTPVLVQVALACLLVMATSATYQYMYASKPRTDTVYRIRGIPSAWNEERLLSCLAAKFEASEFAVGSLAVEYHGKSKTATVDCRRGTPLPRKLHLSREGESASVTADSGFHGVTTLYCPPKEDHKVK